MKTNTPKIKDFDFKKFLKQARAIAPFYVPEWDANQEKQHGTALLKIYLHMAEYATGRLNQAPFKNFVAFLDMMGIKMLPAQPATAYVTFTLAEGTAQSVLAPIGTELAAEGISQEGESEEVIFQTRKNLLVSPAKLEKVIGYNSSKDEIYILPKDYGENRPFSVFGEDGKDVQEHALYIAHEDLFNQKKPTKIELDFEIKQAPGTEKGLMELYWEYWNGEKWSVFDSFVNDDAKFQSDETNVLQKSGIMTLEKNFTGEMQKHKINITEDIKIENRWIRCRLNNPLSGVSTVRLPEIDTIRIGVSPLFPLSPFSPDLLFSNDVPIEFEEIQASMLPNTVYQFELNKPANKVNSIEIKQNVTGILKQGDILEFTNELNENETHFVEDVEVGEDNDVSIVKLGTKLFFNHPVGDSVRTILVREVEIPIKAIDLVFPNEAVEIVLPGDGSPGKVKIKFKLDNIELLLKTDSKLEFEYSNLTEEGTIESVNKNGITLEEVFSNEGVTEASVRLIDVRRKDADTDVVIDSRNINVFIKFDVNNIDFPLKEGDILEFDSKTRVTIKSIDKDEKEVELEQGQIEFKKPPSVKLLTALRKGETDVAVESLEGQRIGNNKVYIPKDDDGNEIAYVIFHEHSPESVSDEEKGTLLGLVNEENSDFSASQSYLRGDILRILPTIKPFGELPRIFDTFYIASDEAFSKKGARVTLTLEAGLYDPKGEHVNDIGPVLSWEYWSGKSWSFISADDRTRNFKRDGEISFSCPEDIEKTEVNGEEKYWVRVRIVDGDYGKEIEVVPDGAITKIEKRAIHYPIIKEMTINYESVEREPDHCLARNNLNIVDVTENCKNQGDYFFPFIRLGEDYAGIFLGFSHQLTSGPLRMLFDLEEQTREAQPKMEWLYWNGSDWRHMNVTDKTENLTKIGILEWIGGRDFKKRKMFGRELYWIKGIAATKHSKPPRIRGIYLNTTETYQASFVEDEVLGSGVTEAGQEFSFQNQLIISQDVMVREPEMPDDADRRKILKDEDEDAIRIEGDEEQGEDKEIWVCWHEVDDFDESKPKDRHYTINKRLGSIRFGDGVEGMVPPKGDDNIKVDYRFGGGKIGNVPIGAISGMKSAIPFVEEVFNHLKADGGSETEVLEETAIRGPQRLKNRGRAVTVEDFEWIAKNASRKVARAKCLPNIDKNGRSAPGWVTIVIVPRLDEEKPFPTRLLMDVVEKGLRGASANTVIAPQQFLVRGPYYARITVTATVVPVTVDDASEVEKRVVEKLRTYLHPLKGGPLQKGWDFGRKICLPDLLALLEGVEGLDHVTNITLSKDDEQVEGDVPLGPHTLPFSGDHIINLRRN
ncbi:MAG: putative baseplate assembly protein [Deltaproteobacteria bacterium]|nr:putative baseplate assembly protein [Deltaproteobacteria bacterium]MCP5007168.1 putative baseplate assembly protein [Planctomycetota bacterium]